MCVYDYLNMEIALIWLSCKEKNAYNFCTLPLPCWDISGKDGWPGPHVAGGDRISQESLSDSSRLGYMDNSL